MVKQQGSVNDVSQTLRKQQQRYDKKISKIKMQQDLQIEWENNRSKKAITIYKEMKTTTKQNPAEQRKFYRELEKVKKKEQQTKEEKQIDKRQKNLTEQEIIEIKQQKKYKNIKFQEFKVSLIKDYNLSYDISDSYLYRHFGGGQTYTTTKRQKKNPQNFTQQVEQECSDLQIQQLDSTQEEQKAEEHSQLDFQISNYYSYHPSYQPCSFIENQDDQLFLQPQQNNNQWNLSNSDNGELNQFFNDDDERNSTFFSKQPPEPPDLNIQTENSFQGCINSPNFRQTIQFNSFNMSLSNPEKYEFFTDRLIDRKIQSLNQ